MWYRPWLSLVVPICMFRFCLFTPSFPLRFKIHYSKLWTQIPSGTKMWKQKRPLTIAFFLIGAMDGSHSVIPTGLNHINRFEVWPQIQNSWKPQFTTDIKTISGLKDITWVMRGATGQHQSKTTSRSYTPENPLDLRNSFFKDLVQMRKVTGHLAALWKLCRPDWFNRSLQSIVTNDDDASSRGGGWKRLSASATTFSRPGMWVISAYTCCLRINK